MREPNHDSQHLATLRAYYAKHGAMPSYAAISKLVGFAAKTSAVKLAQRLREAGFLRLAPGGRLAPTERFLGIPLAASPVRAGVPEPLESELVDECVDLGQLLVARPENTVVIRVKGDSMREAGILDGDLAVVERCSDAAPGAHVVAEVDGEFTLKELAFEDGMPVLLPRNPDFEPIRPASTLTLFGTVRCIVRRYPGGNDLNHAYVTSGETR
jgi:repressor LexA